MPCAGTCNRELICEEMLFNISEFCERFSDCHLVCAGDFNVNLDSCDVCRRLFVNLLLITHCSVATIYSLSKKGILMLIMP